jgi:hypothetical protein
MVTNVTTAGFYVVQFDVQTGAWTYNCKTSPTIVIQPVASGSHEVLLAPDTTPPPGANPYPDGICSLSAKKVVQLPAGPLNVIPSGTVSWTLTITPYQS